MTVRIQYLAPIIVAYVTPCTIFSSPHYECRSSSHPALHVFSISP